MASQQDTLYESLLQQPPRLSDAYALTVPRSYMWYVLSRELDVSFEYRLQLEKENLSDDSKLQCILQKWLETKTKSATWSNLIEALKASELSKNAQSIEKFLKTTEAAELYGIANKEAPTIDVNAIKEGIQHVKGSMKVARVLLHGAPGAGKTSVKRLILSLPPLTKRDEESTKLLENPVRAISTSRILKNGRNKLEEVDEEYLIRMIQKEIKNHVAKPKSKESSMHFKFVEEEVCNISQVNKSTCCLDNSPELHENEMNDVTSDENAHMSSIMSDIAKDIDLIDPTTPSFFEHEYLQMIDSGGQPQFSDLLPLVFKSESHDHIATIPLNEKLEQKPTNWYRIKDKVFNCPDHILLSHFDRIQRLCQLAKASDSKVFVVGTHLDQENKEETLADKNLMLKPLLEKYRDNLVLPNNNGDVIFAVNAMAPEGEEREKYATMLQTSFLDNCLHDEKNEVPIRWIALELELSRCSRESEEIIELARCHDIAKSLGVKDFSDALSFFNELAVHYYYRDAIPGILFTSVGPISSRLSVIVESSYFGGKHRQDARRLRESGVLTREYFYKLLSEVPKNDLFTNDMFLKLIKYLRIVFEIDQHKLFIPSILPVGKVDRELVHYQPVPLVLYWYDEDYQEVRILPQSYFHALIVELLRKDDVKLSSTDEKQCRSDIVLKFILEKKRVCTIRLVNQGFWLEIFVNKMCFCPKDFPFFTDVIQDCSHTVLKQLKLVGVLGDLQYGLLCPKKKCGKEFPHLCALNDTDGFVMRCLRNEQCTWEEDDADRQFWIKCFRSNEIQSQIETTPNKEKHKVESVNMEYKKIPCQIETKEKLKAKSVNVEYEKAITILKQKIENRTKEKRAQGIIFIVGIYGADGTAVDVENVDSTFKKLNFATYVEKDPTTSQIAQLMNAASECNYPYQYKYVAFYFAGHGGRDEAEKPFIKGLQIDDDESAKILHINEHIISPLRKISHLTRLFFFDCCQSPGSGMAYHSSSFRDCGQFTEKIETHSGEKIETHSGEIIAYATSEGQKSVGDKKQGGIWTYHLCRNLQKAEPITTVLADTFDDVVKEKKEFQEPVVISKVGKLVLAEESFSSSSSTSTSKSSISPGLSMKPSLSVAIKLLKDKSAKWSDIGRWLEVPFDKREGWRADGGLSNEARLEYIINYWLESECHKPVTWAELISVLESNDLASSAEKIRSHLAKESEV